MVSLKQLKYFDAVARSGHFGKAAAHCAISQPALSMQVQELERFLGVQLLERGRNGVILTESGREIAQRAARVLADVRDIVDAARRQGDVLSGPLALGVIPSLAPYLLPKLLPMIRDGFPDLDLHIRETQTQSLVGELVDGELDLLVLALPVEHPDVETVRLFDDRFLLAMATSHRMSNHVRATPDLLEGDRLLLLEEGHCMRDQALAFCNLQKVENINTFGASSLSTLVQMVANGPRHDAVAGNRGAARNPAGRYSSDEIRRSGTAARHRIGMAQKLATQAPFRRTRADDYGGRECGFLVLPFGERSDPGPDFGKEFSACYFGVDFMPSLAMVRPSALLAQLDRASDFDSEGREFESLGARHQSN